LLIKIESILLSSNDSNDRKRKRRVERIVLKTEHFTRKIREVNLKGISLDETNQRGSEENEGGVAKDERGA
jgi:hypothetical protein